MSEHRIGTRQEWRAARVRLLAAEKELTRRGDELARMRQELPWVPVEQEYRFEGPDGPLGLAELFDGRSQLITHHLMFPGCPSCSSFVDGVNGSLVHLRHHDVTFVCVSRSPAAELTAYRERMGWDVPLYSCPDGAFQYDFGTAFTDEQITAGVEFNFRALPPIPDPSMVPHDMSGMVCFAMQDGVVHHTYSTYARGVDAMWGLFQVLDRAPKGRRDDELKLRLHDEY